MKVLGGLSWHCETMPSEEKTDPEGGPQQPRIHRIH